MSPLAGLNIITTIHEVLSDAHYIFYILGDFMHCYRFAYECPPAFIAVDVFMYIFW